MTEAEGQALQAENRELRIYLESVVMLGQLAAKIATDYHELFGKASELAARMKGLPCVAGSDRSFYEKALLDSLKVGAGYKVPAFVWPDLSKFPAEPMVQK